MNRPLQVLLLAKAPVPGLVKTRLAATIGDVAAAEVAAAALLDTAEACVAAVGVERCWLALDGDFANATDGDNLADVFDKWHVQRQRSGSLGDRIAAACAVIDGPLVQIGMDTPQVSAELLTSAADALADFDAALGPALDGGWWAMALRNGQDASAITHVPMSQPTTGAMTLEALEKAGLTVGMLPTLRDIDEIDDLRVVADDFPATHTARIAASIAAEVGQ